MNKNYAQFMAAGESLRAATEESQQAIVGLGSGIKKVVKKSKRKAAQKKKDQRKRSKSSRKGNRK